MLGAIARTQPVDGKSAGDDREESNRSPHEIPLPRLAALALQLAVVVLLIRQFNIQSTVFWWLSALALGGFVIHARLPLRHRLPFFVALSIAGIFLCIGVPAGALLVASALTLIALCHLPVPVRLRLVLVITCGVLLAAVNTGWLGVMQWRPAKIAMPVLGSMFMFRMIIYLYDLAHTEKNARPTFWQTSAYFLLLPNVCFPLFPVVDFNTSKKTYYNARAEEIYATGIRWIFAGVLHILAYRLVLDYVAISQDKAITSVERLRFVFSKYLLYLQVSGQFHIAIGMLQLFGFNLPRTHNRYFLARSFTDVWQRVNIYWTDFMQKLVFYPVTFQLRKWNLSIRGAAIGSTCVVILATWALHPYQTFWLRRRFPLTLADAAFWGVTGVLMVGTTLYDLAKRRRRGAPQSAVRARIGAVVSTVLTFCTMSLLWSLWSMDSLGDWFALVSGR